MPSRFVNEKYVLFLAIIFHTIYMIHAANVHVKSNAQYSSPNGKSQNISSLKLKNSVLEGSGDIAKEAKFNLGVEDSKIWPVKSSSQQKNRKGKQFIPYLSRYTNI